MAEREPTFELGKPFKIDGKWWLPGRRENMIGGELSFTPENGLRLHLDDKLNDDTEASPKYEIILGLTSEAVEMTLVDCLSIDRPTVVTSNGSGHNVVDSEIFIAHSILHGICIESKDEIVFPKISVDFPLLFEWLNIKPFDVTFDDDMAKATITLSDFKIPEIEVADGISISIPSGGTFHSMGHKRFVAGEHYQVFVKSRDDYDLW